MELLDHLRGLGVNRNSNRFLLENTSNIVIPLGTLLPGKTKKQLLLNSQTYGNGDTVTYTYDNLGRSEKPHRN